MNAGPFSSEMSGAGVTPAVALLSDHGGADYIIVGVGSAGCVLANSLSEGLTKLHLPEAGGSNAYHRVRIPAGAPAHPPS